MAISKRLRFEVLRRDDFRCRYCGLTASDAELHLDHVIPSSLGGEDKPENLVACCKDCNAGKAASGPDEGTVADVAEDAARWAAAMRLVAEEEYDEQCAIANACSAWTESWDAWTFGGEPAWAPADWRESIGQFVRAGLSATEIEERVDYTMSRHDVAARGKWKYFCGSCWGVLRARQERARELLAEGRA